MSVAKGTLLLVDDEKIVHRTLGPYVTKLGWEIESAYDGAEALTMVRRAHFDLALVDVRMPDIDGLAVLAEFAELEPELPVVIITGHGNMEMSIQALRHGAADFLTKPVKLLELEAVLERISRLRALERERARLKRALAGMLSRESQRGQEHRFVGRSDATEEVKALLGQAAAAKCDSILITGETGTGKEVAARELHTLATRDSRDESPFIAVSCPAIPDTLVESELFGHRRGAFTGATDDRAGCLELADGGTLFLDEVGDLSTQAQAKLLRVLETRQFRRVGDARELSVSVRVVAATNQNLEEHIRSGRFRADLFYRLNLISIELTPLRYRRDDILPLGRHFLRSYCRQRGLLEPAISREAKQLLLAYDYPGNVRELRNIIERAVIVSRCDTLDREHLPLLEQRPSDSQGASESSTHSSRQDEERDLILGALKDSRWNRKKAAETLGMPYSTLRYKIDRFGLKN